jgi:hypothetical protein
VPGPDAPIPVPDADLGRRASLLALLALAWGILLIAGALLLPVYGSATLVAENGRGVLIPVSFPAAVSVAVWVALRVKCSRGGRAPELVAWVLIAVLSAFCLVAILSIGLLVVPAAALLAVAAVMTPAPLPEH